MSSAFASRVTTGQACQKQALGRDFRNMTSYPDHGSPVRKAREAARAKTPCAGCGTDAEPVLRKPHPFSAEWELDRSTYFGCAVCGALLARLSGPAANRPSDVPSDRLPDPAGMLATRIQRALDGVPPCQRPSVLESALADVARDHGPGLRVIRADDRAGSIPPAFTLLWRGEPWLTFGLEGDRARILEEPG